MYFSASRYLSNNMISNFLSVVQSEEMFNCRGVLGNCLSIFSSLVYLICLGVNSSLGYILFQSQPFLELLVVSLWVFYFILNLANICRVQWCLHMVFSFILEFFITGFRPKVFIHFCKNIT